METFRPLVRLSGLAPLRKQVARLRTGLAAPRRLHFVLTNADGGGSTSWRAAISRQ